MTNTEAISIINKIRIGSPFTMGLSIDEFVKGFRKRYLQMYGEVIPNDYISVANVIIGMNTEE